MGRYLYGKSAGSVGEEGKPLGIVCKAGGKSITTKRLHFKTLLGQYGKKITIRKSTCAGHPQL